MTHPMDYLSDPQSESGRGLHTQESGDAGLSSNMQHEFSDDYTEGARPVAEKGSNVKPFSKGEGDVFYCPERPGKVWSGLAWLSVIGRAADLKVKPHPAMAEEGFLKPPTVAAVKVMSKILPENNLDEETHKVYPGTAEGQRDEEVGENSCTADTKMDTTGNAEKPKGLPLVPRGRNSSRYRKNQKLYLLCWVAVSFFHAPVSAAPPGAQRAADRNTQCFVCMDKARCPKLLTIYGSDDTSVYEAGFNETFPACCGISSPGPKRCVVCHEQSNITIICGADVRGVQVEGSDGGPIKDIAAGCAQQFTCTAVHRARYGLIPGIGLFLIVLAALGICGTRCKKNRDW